MLVSLTVIGGVHNGRVIPIPGPSFLIGRDPKCHLRPASEDVSREHCAILLRGDQRVFLKDYGSRNGTILNHRMLVHGEMQLEDGDVIEVGPLSFRLNIKAGIAAPPPAGGGPKAESALEVGEDIHNDIFSVLNESEPSAEETIQVSRPRLVPQSAPMKDAGPRIVDD